VIRLLIAAATSLLVSLVGTHYLIKLLTARAIGQHIREDGPQHHHVKAGTPTMGGLAVVGGAFAGYVVSNLYRGIYTRTGLVVMMAIVGAGVVGLLDDWIKVRRARNLGLTKRTKVTGQLVVAVGFAVAMVHYATVTTSLSFTRPIPDADLGPWIWACLAVLWVLGSTNAVNLTDGLDGLAGGSSALGFAAYTIIAFWQFRHPDTYGDNVPHALDLAVISVSMMGACVGFLWWNANPARIFMGDAGSLALGGAFATLALATDTMLLLPLLGGLFVMETLSVMVQVAAYRLQRGVPPSQRRRPLRMAPLHHHFELGGWPETTVLIRFWIIAGLCTAVALGVFYADFLAQGGID
jgi:phospho-N-acetylmuramoyl-pentapeptide-transferase